MVKPKVGEKLWVYLFDTEHAVSSVLICEEGKDQKHVYYVSHALKGPELRYVEVEKLALALIVTVRKLSHISYLIQSQCSQIGHSEEL